MGREGDRSPWSGRARTSTLVAMSHPPSSYLSPAAIEGALQMARHLREASEDVRVLVSGAPVGGGGGGRVGAAAVAMRNWIGPHRITFEQMIENEVASAETARTRLDDEADAWAQFWADATNARQQRHYDEAMSDHRRAMNRYHQDFAAYQDAIASDPASTIYLPAPRRPIGPTPPVPVSVPTAAGGYRPTG